MPLLMGWDDSNTEKLSKESQAYDVISECFGEQAAELVHLFDSFNEEGKIDKTPHECRHTFESILDSKGANRKCIDLMMGHVSKDVGNRVYNHKTLEELKTAIDFLKVN